MNISERSVRNCNLRTVSKDKWEKVFGEYKIESYTSKKRYDSQGNLIEEK